MLKDAVAVLDIGSSKVTALIGERAVNNNFTIRAIAERTHEAFYDGSVDDLKSLESAVLGALDEVCVSAKVTVNELFIGVPGEFLTIRNKQYQILLNKRRTIKKKDVDELYDDAVEAVSEGEFELIDRSAVYYFIDGNSRVAEPIGEVSESLSGYLTFFLCKKVFLSAMRNVLAVRSIKKLRFVPVPLAESLYLFDRQERYAYVILVDVGYITTSVSIILGDGMLYQGAFPMGGGHVSAYLTQNLNIDFSLAEKLKRKINLSLNTGLNECYEVFVADEQHTFKVSVCNEIVCNVLDGIAEKIDKLLNESHVKLPHSNNVSISLTGGGISFMRGAKEYLSKRLEMGVGIVSPDIPFMNKPDESSKLSLLDYCLDYKKKNK